MIDRSRRVGAIALRNSCKRDRGIEFKKLEIRAIRNAHRAITRARNQPDFPLNRYKRVEQARIIAALLRVRVKFIQQRRLHLRALRCRQRRETHARHRNDRRRITKHRARRNHDFTTRQRDECARAKRLRMNPRDRVGWRFAFDAQADVEHRAHFTTRRIEFENHCIKALIASRTQSALEAPQGDIIDRASNGKHGNALSLSRGRNGSYEHRRGLLRAHSECCGVCQECRGVYK